MLNFLNHPVAIFLRLLQVLVAVFIFFYAALMPADGSPNTIHPLILHLMGNFLLLGSTWLALFHKLSPTVLLLACGMLSIAAELAQSFTDTRISDPVDFGANALGLLLAYCLCQLIEKTTPPLRNARACSSDHPSSLP